MIKNIDYKAKIWPKLLLVVLVWILFYGTSYSQVKNSKQKLDSVFQYYVTKKGFNGTILIGNGREKLYSAAFGCSDCKSGLENDINTPFYIASISKTFTATAILNLFEEGKVDIDNSIDIYFPLLPQWTTQISIRNLLNHTSGIPDYIQEGWVKEDYTNAQVFSKLKKVEVLNFKPGSKFRYSNTGYVLLANIIEIVTGNSYYEYLDQTIFSVCGMESTWVRTIKNPGSLSDAPKAIGYRSNLKNENDYNLYTYGDGGIYSTVIDLQKFDWGLRNQSIIDKKTMNEMLKPTQLRNGTTKPYGLGWFLGQNIEGRYIYHTGGLAGFRTYFEIQWETYNTIIFLNNNSFNELEKIRNSVVKILEGREL